MQILVATPAIPKPDTNSGWRRLTEILAILAEEHQITVWSAGHEGDVTSDRLDQYALALTRRGITVVPRGQSFRALMFQRRFDVGMFCFYWLAETYMPIFRRTQPHSKVIVDSVDVHFAREESAVRLGIKSAADALHTKRRELAVYNSADVSVAVSDSDRHILVTEGVSSPIAVVRNIVNASGEPVSTSGKTLVFVGGFDWPPNSDGILWFVREVWPAVQISSPAAALEIIGSNPTPEVLALGSLHGVEVLGYVPDTLPHLQGAAVSVAPLRYGGGMKGKVNEAMAIGLPVVTTTIGAQGLSAVSGEHLLIADEADAFAAAVVRLLDSPSERRTIGRAGQRLTVELCSRSVASRTLRELLDGLCGNRGLRERLITRLRYLVALSLEAGRTILHPGWWLRRGRA